MLQDDARALHPVGALADNQVADDVERTPGILSVFSASFIAAHPDIGQAAEQRVQGCGSTSENRRDFGKTEFRHGWHVSVDAEQELWTQAARGIVVALVAWIGPLFVPALFVSESQLIQIDRIGRLLVVSVYLIVDGDAVPTRG